LKTSESAVSILEDTSPAMEVVGKSLADKEHSTPNQVYSAEIMPEKALKEKASGLALGFRRPGYHCSRTRARRSPLVCPAKGRFSYYQKSGVGVNSRICGEIPQRLGLFWRLSNLNNDENVKVESRGAISV